MKRRIEILTKFHARREPHRCPGDLIEGVVHTTGFLLPVDFTNLFTDRYSSDHGATHKSGSEYRTGRKTPVYVRSVRIASGSREETHFVLQRSRKLIPISTGGGQGCRKYEREHLLRTLSFFSILPDHGGLLLCSSRANFHRRSATKWKLELIWENKITFIQKFLKIFKSEFNISEKNYFINYIYILNVILKNII